MSRIAFLLSMCISGIKNIDKEIRIDFYGKSINNKSLFEKNNVKGIYGENGSGKTAIITAVSIVKEFMFNTNYLRDSRNQLLLCELINKKSREFVIKFEFVTEVESLLIYDYEVRFAFDENEEAFVSYESLKYKKNSSKNISTTLFVCDCGNLVCLNINENLHDTIIEKTRNLLIKQSALFQIFTILGNEKSKSDSPLCIICPVLFFILLYTHFDKEDKHSEYLKNLKLMELKVNSKPDELLDELVKGVPTSERRIPISEFVEYEKSVKRLEHFVRLFKPDLKTIDIDKTVNKDYYECRLILDYGAYRVNREFESTGIKKIIELYDAFVQASNGGIVFIDELDSNINDVYLCKLIEYYKYYGKGQLCFTSHNTDPMSVLKDNNKSIDFLTRNNGIVPWVKNGHYTPDNSYKNGMIEGMPFNIDSSDFISIFEGE